ALCGAGRGERDGVRTGAPGGPGSGFLPPARARGESRQHRAARSTGVADREDALARNAGGVPRDSVRALGWTTEHSLRSAPGGSFFSRGVAGAEVRRAIQDETGGSLRGGARRFSALTSVALRAPSVSAERKAKPDRSCAIKTGHFNVLPTAPQQWMPRQCNSRGREERLQGLKESGPQPYDFRVAQTQKAREICRRGPSLAVLAVVAI